MVNDETVLIGDIARTCGVSVDTIRHYERKGVIDEVTRGRNGYRVYPRRTISRVRLVRHAMTLGFTLDELAQIFKRRAAGQAPCRSVRDLTQRKLADVEAQIAALTAMRGLLITTIESWNVQLANTVEGGFAHLLESLVEMEKE